jgi:hypothetical protein
MYTVLSDANFFGPCMPIGFQNADFLNAMTHNNATDMSAFVIEKESTQMVRMDMEPADMASHISRMPSTTRYLSFCRECREVGSVGCRHDGQRKITFDGPSFRDAIMNQPQRNFGYYFRMRVENAPLNQ